MKTVFVMPYCDMIGEGDFETGVLKGASIVYKKHYYPFVKIGNVFTFTHGFFSLNEADLAEKRKECKLKHNEVLLQQNISEIENPKLRGEVLGLCELIKIIRNGD